MKSQIDSLPLYFINKVKMRIYKGSHKDIEMVMINFPIKDSKLKNTIENLLLSFDIDNFRLAKELLKTEHSDADNIQLILDDPFEWSMRGIQIRDPSRLLTYNSKGYL